MSKLSIEPMDVAEAEDEGTAKPSAKTKAATAAKKSSKEELTVSDQKTPFSLQNYYLV